MANYGEAISALADANSIVDAAFSFLDAVVNGRDSVTAAVNNWGQSELTRNLPTLFKKNDSLK